MASRNSMRKHFFIDPKLQGRYMVTFLVPMLVMLLFMLFTLVVVSQGIASSTSRIIREEVDRRVTAALQDRPEPSTIQYAVALEEVERYLRGFPASTRYRQALISSLVWVVGVGVCIVVVEIVLLTMYFSHKVAGPIYRLEKVCHNVIDGSYTESVVLRKGDELQNLAALLGKTIQVTRKRLVALRDEPAGKKREALSSELQL